MATERISVRLGSFKVNAEQTNLRLLLEALQNDMAANNAAFAALTAKINVLTAKLNADAGVTDTNYAVDFNTVNPPALTFLK